MRRLIPFFFPALLLAVGVQNAQAQVDVTGTWEISWETPRGATTSTFTFEQEEDTFTGTAQMAMGGRGAGAGGGTREIEITEGKVDGDRITFNMATSRGERSFTFTFAGTVDGDAMEGTMTTLRGENPFTGKRKE
jgi:hypothetical protein